APAIVRLMKRAAWILRRYGPQTASEIVQRQRAIDPGVTFGHIHAEQLGNIWQQAAKHGKRKLVLEITADALGSDEWDGHINVEVKESQTWAEYEQAQAEARAQEVN
ncbi:hypothetical protein, partial [Deinococcus sp.]|uniref:hypothetical protein n=1 Tax=Deinococcus sp. TaxID=47478 RepID=UPI0025C5DC58